MVDFYQAVGGTAIVSLVGLCWKLSKSNGSKHNNCVKQPECHSAQDAIKDMFNTRIEDLKSHIDTRIDDLKDIIKSNGKS